MKQRDRAGQNILMPFQRPFRFNKQALDWLLAPVETSLPPAPSSVLLDWVATIPSARMRARAKRALIRKFGIPNRWYLTNVTVTDFQRWYRQPFDPVVYVVDERTLRRTPMPRATVERMGLLNTAPRVWNRVPPEVMSEWLRASASDREKLETSYWMDADGREFEVVDGRLILRC